jgi:hypothetical protein
MFSAFIIIMTLSGPVQIDSANGPHTTIEECHADLARGVELANVAEVQVMDLGCKKDEDALWI